MERALCARGKEKMLDLTIPGVSGLRLETWSPRRFSQEPLPSQSGCEPPARGRSESKAFQGQQGSPQYLFYAFQQDPEGAETSPLSPRAPPCASWASAPWTRAPSDLLPRSQQGGSRARRPGKGGPESPVPAPAPTRRHGGGEDRGLTFMYFTSSSVFFSSSCIISL